MSMDLDVLCDALELFETRKAEQERAITNVKKQIMDQLNEMGLKTTTTKKGRKLTIVEPIKSSWDEGVLKDVLGQFWPEVVIVREILDESKLEAVCDREQIKPETLQEAVIETDVKPYLKITKPKGKTSGTR